MRVPRPSPPRAILAVPSTGSTGCAGSYPLQDQADYASHMLKLAFFLFQPLPALGRQRVVTCPTAGFGIAPLGFRPPVDQQSLEGWIESALAHLQCVARR